MAEAEETDLGADVPQAYASNVHVFMGLKWTVWLYSWATEIFLTKEKRILFSNQQPLWRRSVSVSARVLFLMGFARTSLKASAWSPRPATVSDHLYENRNIQSCISVKKRKSEDKLQILFCFNQNWKGEEWQQ